MGGPDQDGFGESLLGLENNGHPGDFFKRLANPKRKALELFNSEPDLSLNLSLGACYSEVPKEKPLLRGSSLAGVLTLSESDGEFLSLARSSSLPTEAGHEQKTVRELQSMKRIGASRMLFEKHQQGRGGSQPHESPPETVTPPQLATWAAESAARNGAFCRAIGKIKSKFNAPTTISVQGENSSANGCAGAGAGACACASHFHPLFTFRAMVANGKAVEPATSQPLPVGMLGTMANGKAPMPAEAELKNLCKRIEAHKSSTQGHGGAGMETMMRQMPSVTTIGEGPNGKKIEGFLYNYMKGQVSIVCVCHGNFFTPAEFVRHAGGHNVANPMKHINVLPFSF